MTLLIYAYYCVYFIKLLVREILEQCNNHIKKRQRTSEYTMIIYISIVLLKSSKMTFAIMMTGSSNYKGLYHNIEACTAGEKSTTDSILYVTTNTYER